MEKPVWVYILKCADESYYTGHTGNLERRIAEHQSGEGADWTKKRWLFWNSGGLKIMSLRGAFFAPKQSPLTLTEIASLRSQ